MFDHEQVLEPQASALRTLTLIGPEQRNRKKETMNDWSNM